MITKNKNISKMEKKGISNASLILNEDGIIISFNEKISAIFEDVKIGGRIEDSLDETNAQLFERLVLNAKSKNEFVKDNVSVILDGQARYYDIFITPFIGEEEKLYFVSFNKTKKYEINSGDDKVILLTGEIEELVKDEKILNLIKTVKNEYPFTIIGKSKVKKLVNDVDESFWVKNPGGQFVLVNEVFAKALGLRSFKIEGRKSDEVIPSHLSKFISEIDDYIASTLNSVVVEGAISYIFDSSGNKSVLQLPIFDIDENLVAIIGFTENKPDSNQNLKRNSLNDNIVEFFPDPVISTNSNLVCKSVNKKANEVFGLDKSFVNGESTIIDLLGEENYSKLDFFVNKGHEVSEMDFEVQLDNVEYRLRIQKLFDRNQKVSGFSFVFGEGEQKNLENLLRGNMHDIIMQNSPEPMFIYNVENLKFLEVNNAALSLYGYSREEFIRMDLTDLYAPEDIQTLIESANSTKMGLKYTGPWRHKSKDGKTILVEISKSEIKYQDVVSHLNVVRDVSEKVELDKKMQLFKASFDYSDEMIINTDRDGFITYANSAVTKKTGHSKKEIIDSPFLSLLSDNDRAIINTEIFHSGITETQSINFELKKASGDLLKAVVTATPIKDFDGEIDSFNLIIKVEDEKTEIKDDVVEDHQSGIDSSFLSNLFHEILTPINVIIGFSQEINDSLENPNEEQKEATDIIQQNKKMLLQIMDNAVEFAAIEQSTIKLNPERIVFINLLDQIQENIKRIADNKGVELAYGKISSSLTFDSDKQRFISLASLFLNFAINVINDDKIYLSAYQYNSESFIVSLKDGRTGISERLFNGLNELFTQDEDLLRRQFDISRFMIRLARKLVEFLGAEIYPVERNGEPIEFGIKFPSILIVEDDEENVIASESPDSQPKAEHYSAAVEQTAQEPEMVQQRVQQGPGQEPKPLQPVTPEPVQPPAPEPVQPPAPEPVQPPAPEPVQPPAPQPVQPPAPQPVQPLAPQPVQPPAPQPVQPPAPVVEQNAGVSHGHNNKVNANKPLTDLNCLYVEDQVDSQILFKVQMKDFNSIDFANSFEKALPLVKSKKYDFIVMDINLQGEYNGLDALRIIHKLPGYEQVPIIAATAYVLPGDREKFIAAGFIDFISKPVLRDKLMDCLNNIFVTA